MRYRIYVSMILVLSFLIGCGNDNNTNPEKTAHITNILPSSGYVGDSITITGLNFGITQGTSFVTFNIKKATEIISWSETQIKVKVPEGAISGNVSITVKDIKSNEVDFEVTAGDDTTSLVETVLISFGTFQMGNTGKYKLDNNEIPIHTVKLTKSFYMGKYEITQAQWKTLMGDTKPFFFKGDKIPATPICWFEAVDFCNKLSEKENLEKCYTIKLNGAKYLCDNSVTVTCDWSKKGWRLPTEAEWEYACKAGTLTDFYNGEFSSNYCITLDSNLNKIAWFNCNSNDEYQNTGEKSPNNNGLYDMLGNVWEWCWDLYGTYINNSVTDPIGPNSGTSRVIRGGSMILYADNCRSANRGSFDPVTLSGDCGFRICRTK